MQVDRPSWRGRPRARRAGPHRRTGTASRSARGPAGPRASPRSRIAVAHAGHAHRIDPGPA